MKKAVSVTRLLAVTLLASALVACGGGSDDDEAATAAPGGTTTPDGGTPPAGTPATADATDKYVGTWLLGCRAGPTAGTFETERVMITKASATQLNVSFTLNTFNNAACGGTPSADPASGTATIDGQTTGTRNGQTTALDRITAQFPNQGPVRWVATVLSNGRLLIDFDDNNAGSSATVYPTNLNDGTDEYVKQ